ncbi:MAG: DEAD/DEAH box helicase, partial [Ornithinimicrobium sp.]|uniref:DEAD/DEAH box helicase n=1 Tax=Ornithinimicrobium sp. TaxID=1977084 RepID=UPI0026DFDD83
TLSDQEQPGEQTFADLGIREEISSALAEGGIVHPFPIQSLAIPLALSGVDLIGQARTGTGKTLAFGTSLLHRITGLAEDAEDPPTHGKPRALVVAPTRELALQVSRDLALAGAKLKTRVLTIYGGTGYDEQLDTLASGVDVVVGTPGRLLDLLNRRALNLSKIQVLVLDEADEMLDLGFLPDIERLLAATPKDRQVLLFSATMPAPILALARATLNRPVNIRAEGQDAKATVPDVEQFAYQSHNLDKPEIVARLAQGTNTTKMMVFCRTKRAAQRLSDELVDRGFPAAAIHGDLNQAARERALKDFRSDKITILVATDVAARGIDITGVSHVVNLECPDTANTYVHRIGRTARAGQKGVAVTLVDWADATRWKVIDKELELDLPPLEETYSSSPHLFEQLDIPAGTRGKLPGAKPVERKERSERSERGSSERRSGGRSSERRSGDRPSGGSGDADRHRPRRNTSTEAVGDHPRDDAAVASKPRKRRRRRAGVEVKDAAQPSV